MDRQPSYIIHKLGQTGSLFCTNLTKQAGGYGLTASSYQPVYCFLFEQSNVLDQTIY
jgi:hypothetical protein